MSTRQRGAFRGNVKKELEKIAQLKHHPVDNIVALKTSREMLDRYQKRLRELDAVIQRDIANDTEAENDIAESERWDESLTQAICELQVLTTAANVPFMTPPQNGQGSGPQRFPEPNKPPLLEPNVSLNILFPETRHELVHGIGIAVADQVELLEVLTRIRKYIRDRRNVALDRVAFAERRQMDGQSFDDFFISLKKIAKHADLCEVCLETQMTTRIMVGIQDVDTRQKLLAMRPFPTLSVVADTCRGEESAKQNKQALTTGSAGVNKVHAHKRYGKKKGNQGKDMRVAERGTQGPRCGRCGKNAHPMKDDCPALSKECRKCGKKGYFNVVCRAKSAASVSTDPPLLKTVTSVRFQVAVASQPHDFPGRAPVVQVDCYRANSTNYLGSITATPDSAAEATVAEISMLEALNLPRSCLKQAPGVELITANGEAMKCLGSVDITFKLSGYLGTERIYVCKGRSDMLLSWMLAKKLHILPADYPAVQMRSVVSKGLSYPALSSNSEVGVADVPGEFLGPVPENPTPREREQIRGKLIDHYSDVFECEDHLNVMDCAPLVIKLREGVTPFSIRVPRPIPVAWRESVKVELDNMVRQGVIAPVSDSEASEWCHPIVVVAKKDKTPRMCVDLTKLNPYVVRPLHPMLSPKEAVSDIPNNARFFSVFDAEGILAIAVG